MRTDPAKWPPFMRTARVARESGATLRQLQWWDEQGILEPHRDGHIRLYSTKQVFAAIRLAAISKAGVNVRREHKKLLREKWDTVRVIRKPTVMFEVLLLPKTRSAA